jgi:tripartite-type tricarboxylate transporter receptor subunit TctC
MRRHVERLVVAAAAFAAAHAAFAQGAFPSRPVALVVGFAPGGGTDIAARIVARQLAAELGQQVLVENRPGAGGNIATDMVARAAPDGHTIALASIGSLTVAPYLVAKLPYDPRRDLAPLTKGVSFANVLVVHPSFPATTLAEFVAAARAKPGTISYGTSGIGGAGHLAGELFRQLAQIDIVHVAYKGGGPAMTDLLGGQVPANFASAPAALPHVRSGKIRALATTGAARSAFLPDVPTIAESGFPGYDATNWYAFVAPGKTPKDIVDRLNRDLVKSLNHPEIREQLLNNGMEPEPSTPEALAAHIESQLALWGKVVKQAGIQAQ